MELYKKLLFATGAALLLSVSTLSASEQAPRDILNKAYTYLGSMDSYALKAVIIDNEAQDDGTMNKERFDVSIKVDRPGKLRADTKGPGKDRSSYINKGVYTIMDHAFGYYGQLKTPETLDGALDHIFENFGIKAPLAQLLYSDMDKRLKFIKSKNFGTVEIGGTECHYVAFSNLVKEVHIWIATGDEPLVKAYSIIDKMDENEYRTNTSLYWDINAKISESDFVFVAPKGAEKISVQSAN